MRARLENFMSPKRKAPTARSAAHTPENNPELQVPGSNRKSVCATVTPNRLLNNSKSFLEKAATALSRGTALEFFSSLLRMPARS